MEFWGTQSGSWADDGNSGNWYWEGIPQEVGGKPGYCGAAEAHRVFDEGYG